MSDPLIRACDEYVVLEPLQPERILSVKDTLAWLESWLNRLDSLPEDLQDKISLATASQRLLDTSCNLEVQPGVVIQWFAVRVEPHLDDGE